MTTRLLCLTSVLALTAGSAMAEMNFNRIASFATWHNMAEGEDAARETSPEIIVATQDGNTLVYSDSPLGVIGLVDITDPASPRPLGNIDMQGEPTSVVVAGERAYAAVNTSGSYTDPSGKLVTIDLGSKEIVAECDLGGQPDSIAAAKDGSFIAIAIENERDEDLGDGRVGQMPAGWLSMLDVTDAGAACDSLRRVEMTGLAEIAPEDPEPEYVDINGLGETVVTLQENNHIVVVSKDGEVTASFSAGAVDLTEVDLEDDRAAIRPASEQPGRLREPDTVKWLDDDHFATANEGDMDGGSRGWTVWNKDGSVVWESNSSFEHALISIGHYPDKRSDAKGVEPESLAQGTFGGTPMAFVGSERGGAFGVYDVTDPANPVLTQLLPSGIGPESFAVIESRNLIASANETDLIEDGGVRAHVMVYEYQDAPAAYPQLTAAGLRDADGVLVGWGAISGQVAAEDGTLYAVSDSFYGKQPTIFRIDVSEAPAKIVEAIRVTRDGAPAGNMDMEGITLDGDAFWVANEGNAEKGIPHAIYKVAMDGTILEEVAIPEALAANETRFGFEGIARIGDTLWMAVQREWKDDPENTVKLVAYTPATGEWGAVRYEKAQPETGWTGLSEITAHGDYVYVVERDNQIGENAVTKKIYRIPASDMVPAPLDGDDMPMVSKEEVRDLLSDLTATGGFVLDKVEGLAIAADGTAWVSTDNDGVDDHSGETMFFSIGRIE
ncbi:esterase-like activity of phytase family protein [Mangrovicoccus algicola]|uniref:Esterase-like activity of phytase family protein n=1 Tax=Mangrovicoccus algicola TaxID=2771008 RepID=A0A8J7CIM2_9RHOB|nr:esterase-like activity of phytase family protein [Mangrovicoccus algicola]MBE3639750.1 esterase-like activity of phytase family protein [Mangrovicoccus algicola]